MKIYLVTTGGNDYDSSMVVHGAFSSSENANAFIAKMRESEFAYGKDDINKVMELELDEGLGWADHQTWRVGIAADTGEIVEPMRDWRCGHFGLKGEPKFQIFKVPMCNNRLIIRVESSVSADHAIEFARTLRKLEMEVAK
jgi:hypothetical protein